MFLGLGLSWTVAAIYWEGGMRSDEELVKWTARYPEIAVEYVILSDA